MSFELKAIAFTQDSERITPVIQLRFSEEDSKKYITAQVNEYSSDSTGKPIAELDLYFFVQRTFSQLPIGEYFNTTDENGEVRIEFPYDLPGDSAGNVIIIASIEEDDSFESAELSKIASFGVPAHIDQQANKRTLTAASANAPISLLILVNSIIMVVWGIIIYIFTQIYKIRRV
ncbi:MAG: hypothetical protein KAR07_05310 [Spirochaetes bacterium]|nr:hypothetical protein [Spirochaetota bacterium]